MFYIKVKGYFSSAHNLRNYAGSCENLHGHNWAVQLTLRGKRLDETGLLFDFRRAREWLNETLNGLDHKYLNDLPAFRETNPTSENIARYIFKQMQNRLREARVLNVEVHSVEVWENENSCAIYSEDEEE